ncbi:unnamed protein product [Pleuronectes platessa]|uniref:Uncharacterized protein n=1 Tax=Pleuronectes platessa TaxID=8262 RepID=A0A9N7Z379_PLEPL|nr:unnamed protein product [Pleuronectes platessa]
MGRGGGLARADFLVKELPVPNTSLFECVAFTLARPHLPPPKTIPPNIIDDLLVAHYYTALTLSLESLTPLKTQTVSYTRPAPWFTAELQVMKASDPQLEWLYKRSGLTVHL